MLVAFNPDPQIEEAVRRAMVCAPVACEREVHCWRMAIALLDLIRAAYAQGWTGQVEPPAPSGPARITLPACWETAR